MVDIFTTAGHHFFAVRLFAWQGALIAIVRHYWIPGFWYSASDYFQWCFVEKPRFVSVCGGLVTMLLSLLTPSRHYLEWEGETDQFNTSCSIKYLDISITKYLHITELLSLLTLSPLSGTKEWNFSLHQMSWHLVKFKTGLVSVNVKASLPRMALVPCIAISTGYILLVLFLCELARKVGWK